MPSRLEALFPREELDRIIRAVQEAEQGTSGEIVPYVVAESDRYVGAIWRAAAIAGAIPLLALGLLPLVADTWLTLSITLTATIALGAGLAAGLAVRFIPALRRFLTDRATLDLRVAQRAAEAFLSEEVFNTRDRSGILIFLSLMERRVVVLGDAGINARITHSEWNGVVDVVIDGIRAGRHADAVIEGVRRCGALLADRGFTIGAGDTNELPDRLRVGDRNAGKDGG